MIRAKLADGRLPLHRPAVIIGGPSRGGQCDACDGRLMPRQLVMQIPSHDSWLAYLHADCFQVWEDERHRVRIEAA